MCPCRQLRHTESYSVPATHCGILVYLEEKMLFCDVGYGGPVPHSSIEFRTDCIQTVANQIFYFQKDQALVNGTGDTIISSGWFTLIKKSSQDTDKETPLMQVAPFHCYLSDFYGQNLLRSTGDSAYSIMHVTRETPDGYIDLTDYKLRISQGEVYDEKIVERTDLDEILWHYFGIRKKG